MPEQTALVEQDPGDNGVTAPLASTAQDPAERTIRQGAIWVNKVDGDLIAIESLGEAYFRGRWQSGNLINLPLSHLGEFFDYWGSRMPEPRFPLESFREAAPYLRRPFTKEAVKWKVQSAFGDKGCLIVGYIDARLVIERLNLVIPHLWSEDFQILTDGQVICRLTVDGITREDLGRGQGQEGPKGARSDALKRAAVHFGIGVSVYAIPRAELWKSDEKHNGLFNYRHKAADGGRKEQHIYTLTQTGDAKLRERYEKWLEQVGIKAFGEPIDHGDVEDSAGEAPETAAGENEAVAGSDLAAGAAVPLVDANADGLRAECRSVYSAISKLPKGKTRLAPAAFESQLQSASTSHEDLATYLVTLNKLKAELEP